MLNVELAATRCEFVQWQPSQGRIFQAFAYDVETTEIVESRPDLIPQVVLATAFDGQRGVFIHRDDLLAFFEAHDGVPFIGHNIAFDLAVSQQLFRDRYDIYAAVEKHEVWCTMILHRLWALATVGHSARDECGLRHCVDQHLGIKLEKHAQDADGQQVRVNFAKYLGAPLASIPPAYLRYAARDVMATWPLLHALKAKIREVLIHSEHVFGYVNPNWLRDVVDRFGPLTHHLQLRASIVLDAINRLGLCVDRERQQAKLAEVAAAIEASATRLQQAGFVVHGAGSQRDLQDKLEAFHRCHPEVPLKTTDSGKWSTTAEDLALLGEFDEHFQHLSALRGAEKLKTTYLDKMERPVVYPKYSFLASTGRTSCGGGFNLQALPREDGATAELSSIRGCFVPRPEHVFIDSDYAQIELVTLGYVWKEQMRYGSSLFDLINANQDLHRVIAAAVLNKPLHDITKQERAAAKPVSFGRPGGMGTNSLREYALNSFGLNLTLEDVEQRVAAYHRLCPELDLHLQDEVDAGTALAEALQMTPAEFNCATDKDSSPADFGREGSPGWLGGMLLKVLRDSTPTTRNGRAFTAEEINYFWHKAQGLIGHLPCIADDQLRGRQPSEELRKAVSNWAGRRSVFAYTGRLRAGASFCSARNNLFQGVAADGAICALWLLWRAGFQIVAFVHDQAVVECPADDHVLERKAEIERLLIQGMSIVIPDILVKVETVLTKSLDKSDLDSRYSGSIQNRMRADPFSPSDRRSALSRNCS